MFFVITTFILPGGSVKNKEWLEETADKIMVDGSIRPIYWEHWEDVDAKFEKQEKADLIAKHTKGDPANIIAKSVGSLVAAFVIQKIPNQVNKVIICGIPLADINDSEKELVKKSLTSVPPENLIVFQNRNDPHGSFDEVRKLLPDSINVVSKDRSDHEYPYFEDFNKFLI